MNRTVVRLPENGASVPIACALEGDALGTRWQQWRALVARAGTGVLDIPGGIELTFRPESAVELHELVEAERACCGWANWSLTTAGDRLLLTATGPDDTAADSLRAFFLPT